MEVDLPQQQFQISPSLRVGRLTNEFIGQLADVGLANAQQLAEGLSLYIEFQGTDSTADLMCPYSLGNAIVLSSDLGICPAVHVIVELGGMGAVTGTRLRITQLPFHWGHPRNRLTVADIAEASALWPAINKVQHTGRYHRVGNALLFYTNGYNSDNPDLALVAFTTCLEGLFSTMEQEISFRLALRLAHFLGESNETRRQRYDQCREVYKVRSKIVHGAAVNQDSEEAAKYLVEVIVPTAEELARTALRRIFGLELETFFDSKTKVESLFEELLFSDSLPSALAKVKR
ncbi:MAG TPA: hypothetical protein VGQ71_02715 [Terriglobales bacterium]|nr:hypothetical protein [Terriglobales bacterium]